MFDSDPAMVNYTASKNGFVVAAGILVALCSMFTTAGYGQDSTSESAESSKSSIDYVALANSMRGMELASAENNAAVEFLAAMGAQADGPDDIQSASHFEAQWAAVAPGQPTPQGPFFQKPVRSLANAITECGKAPWHVDDFPEVADWIFRNADPLRMIVAGTNKPRCCFPLQSLPPDTGLASTLVACQVNLRSAGKCLVARAMNRLDSGDTDGCLKDLIAARKLALHVGSGGLALELIVSNAIDSITATAEMAVLRSGPLDVETLTKHFEFRYRTQSDLAHRLRFTKFERLMALDEAQQLQLGSLQPPLPSLEGRLDMETTNYEINRVYDMTEEAIGDGETWQYMTRVSEIQGQLGRIQDSLLATLKEGQLTNALLTEDPQALSRFVGRYTLVRTYPAIDQLIIWELKRAAVDRQTILAFSLFAHRYQHGRFPESLSELSLTSSQQASLSDPCADKPFGYIHRENGFVLYSIGRNFLDDHGVGTGEDWSDNGEDYGIQVTVD